MLNREQIDTLYRLHYQEKWSVRRIARHLQISRPTVRKYLQGPVLVPVRRPRASKLDPYKELLAELLEKDPQVPATRLLQILRQQGYEGGKTILGDYLRWVRPRRQPRGFIRMEERPGESFQVDWGHFGSLDYQGDSRRLYAFVLIESHSRRLFVEFTHSQCFETFLRCHQHGFRFMQGVAREIVYDNLLSAVAERDGRLVRFQPRFWAFARDYGFCPRACTPRAAWEKGKCERALGYLRKNFWPLRSFRDLYDVNQQVRQWLKEVANQRRHRETREIPEKRFRPQALLPLPVLDPDYRDTETPLVHKDLRLRFDGNAYCVPQRFIGKRLTLKADSQSVTIYHRHREIVRYPRSWQRGHTQGAERFEKPLLENRPGARRSQAQQQLVAWLGQPAEEYLQELAGSDRVLSRQIRELLDLIREYGPDPVRAALEKAHQARAFGADYVANILYQNFTSRRPQPRLELKDPRLNQLTTDPVSLHEYDELILRQRKEDEITDGETRPTQTHHHESAARGGSGRGGKT
jgi:transposase